MRRWGVLAVALWVADASIGAAPGGFSSSRPSSRPAAGKERLAVVPFDVLGKVPIKDAGRILAERLLPMFAGRYQIVDQAQLKRFLEQADLTIAGLVEMAGESASGRKLPRGVRLRAVRYLVVGTLSGSPDGALVVTARLSDWQTGLVRGGRVAQIEAENWQRLGDRLALLAARLTGGIEDLGPGAEVKILPPLKGSETLEVRIRRMQAIAVELDKGLRTLSPSHLTIALLRRRQKDLADPLAKDLSKRIVALKALDATLAGSFRPAHPKRQAVSEQLRRFKHALDRDLYRLTLGRVLMLDLAPGVRMKFALIPSGRFTMGSPPQEDGRGDDEGPRRQVTIDKPFLMAATEVTQAQYRAVMGGNPSGFKGADLPAERVSWRDATAFCRTLSQRVGRREALPTEAQWEYACRAGSTTPFHTGEAIRSDQANFDGGRGGAFRGRTAPVAGFRPNAWGLHDMHGNVWEWCRDWYGPYEKTDVRNGRGPADGQYRVLRGGSWLNAPGRCRSAARSSGWARQRFYKIGFRVILE